MSEHAELNIQTGSKTSAMVEIAILDDALSAVLINSDLAIGSMYPVPNLWWRFWQWILLGWKWIEIND